MTLHDTTSLAMTPRKTPIQALSLPVLSERMGSLERRVEDLEEADKERQDSNQGIRDELKEHQIKDAEAFGEVKTLIAAVETKLEEKFKSTDARLRIMQWVLAVIFLLGLAGTTIQIVQAIRGK